MLWEILALGALLITLYLALKKTIGSEQGVVCVSGKIPWIGAGLDFVKKPKEFLSDLRAQHGDVFLVHMWGSKFLFAFSPDGLKRLYQVPEEEASFPRATRSFLGLKVPMELLDNFIVVEKGWRDVFTQAMKRQLMDRYVLNAKKTLDEMIDTMPPEGRFELYPFFRRLVHKFGFRCWAGEEAANQYLGKFKDLFDKIDPEQAFVKPISLVKTILTGRKEERKALAEIFEVMRSIYKNRKEQKVEGSDLFSAVVESLPTVLPDKSDEEIQRIATYLLIGLHMASQTNLSSAATWLVINLLTYDLEREKVLARNAELQQQNENFVTSLDALASMEELEKVIYETIRIAQQSLTLRLVRKPMSFPLADGKEFTIPEGYFLATLLNVMNCTEPAVPPVGCPATQFHPARFKKGKLDGCPAGYEYVVSTFGHSRHACPGEKFTLNAFKVFVAVLFDRLELKADWKDVQVPHTQMGAVARTDRPVWVRYKKRRSGAV